MPVNPDGGRAAAARSAAGRPRWAKTRCSAAPATRRTRGREEVEAVLTRPPPARPTCSRRSTRSGAGWASGWPASSTSSTRRWWSSAGSSAASTPSLRRRSERARSARAPAVAGGGPSHPGRARRRRPAHRRRRTGLRAAARRPIPLDTSRRGDGLKTEGGDAGRKPQVQPRASTHSHKPAAGAARVRRATGILLEPGGGSRDE